MSTSTSSWLRAGWSITKAACRLVGLGASFYLARRRARSTFRSTLKEMDLPPDVVEALTREYPMLELQWQQKEAKP